MKREKERDRRREAGGRWQLNGGHRGSFTAIVKGEVRTMSEREREKESGMDCRCAVKDRARELAKGALNFPRSIGEEAK